MTITQCWDCIPAYLLFKEDPEMINREFYLVPEEVFRLGNNDNPKLSNVRPRDVDTTDLNGIVVVIANGRGISVFDKDGSQDGFGAFLPIRRCPLG
jgi:hypothetical protein